MKNLFVKAILLAAALPLAFSASAEEIEIPNYFQGFEESTYGSILPSDWGRIEWYQSGFNQVSYNYSRSGGAPEGNYAAGQYIYAGSQEVSDDYDEEYTEAYDLIVPPKLKGTVTFWVLNKASSYSNYDDGYVEVYNVLRADDGTYVRGAELDITGTPEDGKFSKSEWTKITINAGETPRYIGIRLSNMGIDTFIAETAYSEEIHKMSIDDISPVGGQNFYCDAQGHVNIPLSVTVTNRGNVTLNPGDTDFGLQIKHSDDVLATYSFTEPLAAGATTTVTVNVDYTVPDINADQLGFSVRAVDLISATFKNTNIHIYGYYPRLATYYSGYFSKNIDLGFFSGAKDFDLELKNIGGAPLTINSVDLPEGITTTEQFPLTLAANTSETATFNVSLPSGSFAADIVFNSNGTGDDNVSAVHLTGSTVSDGVWVEDFESTETMELPAGWLDLGNSWGTRTLNDSRCLYSSTSSGNNSKVCSPKINFGENGKLNLQVMKTSSSPYYSPWFKVYYSPDRVNWTELRSYAAADLTAQRYVNEEFDISGEYYIGFEGYYVAVDNVYGGQLAEVGHDLLMTSYDAPANGMINHPVSVTMNLRNLGNDIEDAGSYNVVLTFNGEEVARLEGETTKDLDNEATAPTALTLSFTPHASSQGTLKTTLTFTDDNYTVESPETTINISEEALIASQTTGQYKAGRNSSQVPVYGLYNNSYSEWVYTPNDLGLASGAKINAMTFYVSTSTSDSRERELRLYLKNVDAGFTPTALSDSTTFTHVALSTIEFKDLPSEGAVTDGTNTYRPVLLTFSEPFEYTGGALDCVLDSRCDNYKGTSWLVIDGKALYKNSDTYDNAYNTKTPSESTLIPWALLSLQASAPVVTGTISKAGAARSDEGVAGAAVRLRSGEVWYDAVTDQNGQFSINLFQPDKEYTLSAAARAFKDADAEPVIISADTELPALEIEENCVDANTLNALLANDGEINVTWEAVTPGSLDAGVTYNVYLDGELAGNTTGTSYLISNVAAGAHTVGIAAVFSGINEGDAPAAASQTDAYVTVTGLNGVAVNGIAISTAAGRIIVAADADAAVEVFTLAGQAVADRSFSGETEIAVAAGTYVVSVRTAAGTVSRKLIVR